MKRMDPQTRRLIPVAVLLVLAVVTVGVQLLTVATLAGLTGVQAPRLSVWELIGLWGQGAPSTVSGLTGTDVWHWAFIGLLLALITSAVVWVAVLSHRRRVNPENLEGLATATEVRKHAGPAQLVARARTLRPSLVKPAAEDAGYFIGTYRGQQVWASVEDPMILVGPSRSGKGWYYVLRTIVNAPGAVVATSCKADNVRWTIGARQAEGRPVYVFDPLEKARGVGHALRWNPVVGCEGQRTLERRMSYLVPGDAFSGNTQNGGHWDTLGYAIATGLFHAAALDGKGVDTIWEWVLDKAAARAAVSIIRQHPDGIQEHANFLDSVLTQTPDKRDTEWNTVRTALAYLQSSEVRAWLTPDESETFDVFDFLMDKGTLYLLGSEQGMNGFEKVIGALLGEIDYVADEVAAGSLHNRLDPPVTFVLDEVANFKISTLPTLISAGGGVGKVTVAVFQSKSQMGEWGQSAERAMWDSASLKLVLPGGSDDAELRALSNLVGEIEEDRLQESFSDSGTSRSVSTQDRAVLTATKIRELKVGYGLLFHRSMKPIIVKMPAFNTITGFDNHAAAAQDVAAGMATASVYADRIKARQEQAH